MPIVKPRLWPQGSLQLKQLIEFTVLWLVVQPFIKLSSGKMTNKMKFKFQISQKKYLWYFVTKIVLVIEKTFGIRGWKPRICKNFEMTRTIYSNSESSEEYLVTECFLTCSWRFLMSNRLGQLEFKLEKNIGI